MGTERPPTKAERCGKSEGLRIREPRDIRGSISPLIPGVHTAEQAAEVLGIYSRLRETGYDRLEPLSDSNPFSSLLRAVREKTEPLDK